MVQDSGMPPENGAPLLARCLEWQIEREERIAERVDRHEFGRAFLSPTIPLVWDANWVLIERAGMAADEIIEVADEVIGSAGMHHRTVVLLDPAEGNRLAPGFEARGWETDLGVCMVLRSEPDRDSPIEVAERRQMEIEPLRRRLIREDLAALGMDPRTTTGQLLEWSRRMGAADGDRWFVAPAGGEPESACRLLSRDRVGQVEDVGTLQGSRGQGLARAVTLAAVRASLAAGNELTYLAALANDWPRLFYARLGFAEVGNHYAFRRRPRSTRT
jgi:GNAT superfamily N-acetyltransferase